MLQKRKKWNRKEIIPIVLIILMFVSGFLLYEKMPEKMPIHWNSEGKIDGYGSRFVGLFLMPIITLAIYILMSLIPYIAVYQKNIKSFYFYYFGFKVAFVLFMSVLFIITLLPNLNVNINMNYLILPLIAGLIYFSGILMDKSKRNYFIGIRTPWTLASDNVWNKTHKLGGKGFKIIAIFMVLCVFIGKYAIFVSVGALILFVVYLFYYSYSVYKEEKKK